MSFNSYKPFKKRNSFPKYLIVFMLGISFALFFSSALNIVTGIENATQYIKQIILTSDGSASGNIAVILDGSDPFKLQVYGDTYLSGGLLGSNMSFTTGQFSQKIQSANYCNFAGTLCKTLDDLSVWNKNGSMIYYNSGNVGIGTNNPSQKLHVIGNILSSGTGSFDGNVVVLGNTSTSKLGSSQICDQNMTNCKLNNVGIHTNNSISTISGTTSNSINGQYSAIGGGYTNKIGASYGYIGGGKYNEIMGTIGTIGGGDTNKINGQQSTIGGGISNLIETNEGVIGGGNNNKILLGENGFIGGGESNQLRGNYSTIGGGYTNNIDGIHSTIGGGNANVVVGNYSAIQGGKDNSISADYSFAIGRAAIVNHDYTFLRNGSSSTFSSAKTGTFLINSPNGVGININDPQATLDVNGSLNVLGSSTISDLTVSSNFKVPAISSAPGSSNDCSSDGVGSIKYEGGLLELCVCDGTTWRKVYSGSLVCIPSELPN